MNLTKKLPAINSVPNKLLYLPDVNGMLPNKSILKQYWTIIFTAKKTNVIIEIKNNGRKIFIFFSKIKENANAKIINLK
jgi:hypothetical protein